MKLPKRLRPKVVVKGQKAANKPNPPDFSSIVQLLRFVFNSTHVQSGGVLSKVQ